MAHDWSQLPNDLLSLIGTRLNVEIDRYRFRSVCESWKWSRPPWLMLAEPQSGNNNNPPRGFVGLGADEQKVYEFDLPEAHQTRCVGSTGTWLITVDLHTCIRLLNPFSRLQFDLPSQSTFEYGKFYLEVEPTAEDHRDYLLRKVILSSTPSSSSTFSNSRDCIAMAIYNCQKRVAIARPGDASWTSVENHVHNVEDIIFYREQFYLVNSVGMVMVCDIGDALPEASVLTKRLEQVPLNKKLYLVEWMGELLLVVKFVVDPDPPEDDEDEDETMYETEKFQVYKLDFTNAKWDQLNSLGDYSLFLGVNTSVSLLVSNYTGSLRKNCIYFTDDYAVGYFARDVAGGLDMGVFDLEDKSIQPHYRGISTSMHSPPLWVIPTPTLK